MVAKKTTVDHSHSSNNESEDLNEDVLVDKKRTFVRRSGSTVLALTGLDQLYSNFKSTNKLMRQSTDVMIFEVSRAFWTISDFIEKYRKRSKTEENILIKHAEQYKISEFRQFLHRHMLIAIACSAMFLASILFASKDTHVITMILTFIFFLVVIGYHINMGLYVARLIRVKIDILEKRDSKKRENKQDLKKKPSQEEKGEGK